MTVGQFGGLNLLPDPIDVGAAGARDTLNVDLDQPGRIRTRNGWALIGSAASTQAPGPMATYNDNTPAPYIITKTDAAVTTAYSDSGFAVATTAQVASSNNGYARFGDPSNSWLFMADGSATLRRFNGAAWANVAITFSAEHLAVTPSSNRLVVASGSRVGFSDPGVPGTFGATNFVDLRPGDGESITALVTWRDYVIAFKQTKFFVFYAESTNAVGGTPVFNYRTVDTGVGCARDGCAAAAGPNGVFFTNFQGVYVTTGDTPRYVSRALEPWLQSTSGTLSGVSSTMGIAGAVLAFHKGRLYATDTVNTTTLVYDPERDYWLIWDLDASGIVAGTYNGIELLYFGVTTSKKLARWNDSGQVTDAGTAIVWSYTSGKYSPGEGDVAIIRETSLFGTGTVTLTVSSDRYADQSGAVTLGTSPTPAEGWLPKDQEGQYFQHKLDGSGPATVDALTHHVSFVKSTEIG